MTQLQFASFLTTIFPDIRKLVSYLKYRGYFGIYDNDDIFQEIVLTLLTRVPKSYKEERGDLKKYCMTAAYRCIQKVANISFKDRFVQHIDWQQDFEQCKVNRTAIHGTKMEVFSELIKKMIASNPYKSIEYSIVLDDLVVLDKDFMIVRLLYKYDCDRGTLCRVMKISNAYVTKMLNRARRKIDNKKLHEEFILK